MVLSSSDGDLEVTGSVDVSGTAGDVHANGDLDIDGSADISGYATASGTYTGSEPGTGGAPPVDLPEVDPSDYRHYADFVLTSRRTDDEPGWRGAVRLTDAV